MVPSGLTVRRTTVPGTRVRPGTEVVGLTLQLEAAGALPIEVSQLGVAGYGTVTEPDFLGALRAVHDQDQDGEADAGEPVLGRLAAPAFAQDDGAVVLTLSPPLVVTPGAPAQLLLCTELLLPALNRNRTLGSLPGLTIVHALRDAVDVVARANGSPVPVSGRWPVEGVLVYQLAEHVLISEVGIGSGGDYIELFNPTPDVIDLSDYYLTDYTDANGVGYWNLPQGHSFNPRSGSDFLIKFPPGSSLRPGAVWVVALWGGAFETTFGRPPILSAYDDHYDGIGVLGMIASFEFADDSNPPRWRSRPNHNGGRLRREGEALVLFTWYGGPDLVQDVDIVAWGDAAPPGDARIDKTGFMVDGPDADTTPGAYLPETPAAQQTAPPAPGRWATRWALRRVDFLETGERQRGGNGISGNDETSEPWDRTFQLDYPDPWNP